MDISRHSNPEAFALLHRRKRAGFTLVEVALALGVLSFGMIATFGLIPTGISTFHQAVDTSVGSQIVQRVVNDARESDFSSLTTDPTTGVAIAPGATGRKAVRYFDSQGTELTGSSGSIYEVNTRVAPQTTLPNAGPVSTLATVTIQIVNDPAHRIGNPDSTNLWTNSAFSIATYSALVARNQ